MHFIIETEAQLQKLSASRCFVQVITNNHYYHPKLSAVSLVYYYDFTKGYLLCVDHSESFSIDFETVSRFVNSHEEIYVFDKKLHSYFFDHSKIKDLHFTQMFLGQEPKLPDFDTSIHRCIEREHRENAKINQIIPISKHYEKSEKLKDYALALVDRQFDYLDVSEAYRHVESQGIAVNQSILSAYKIDHPDRSIKSGLAYNSYNLYNQTGRPTNSYNSVNFLAVPKEKKYRDCFIAKNDYLVEFDFDAYHPRLIAKEIGVELPDEPFHHYMGKLYFQKDTLTEEEYSASKERTFKQLYGGVQKEYRHIEFFAKMEEFVNRLWDEYTAEGELTLPTGLVIKRTRGMNAYKVFNYFIQNLETRNNYFKITKILSILQNKSSKLVLITYDSFLIDYSTKDEKETLLQIRAALNQDGIPVKHRYGVNYNL